MTALENHAQAFKGKQEHNEERCGRLKKEQNESLGIKHIIYPCTISLDWSNCRLDTREAKISELESNQTKAQTF